MIVRFCEWIYGPGPMDGLRLTITHNNLQTTMTKVRAHCNLYCCILIDINVYFLQAQKSGEVPTSRLYNLRLDPLESDNIWEHKGECILCSLNVDFVANNLSLLSTQTRLLLSQPSSPN
jgi:hypothetical protein